MREPLWATALLVAHFKDLYLEPGYFKVHTTRELAESFARGAEAAGDALLKGRLVAVLIVSSTGAVSSVGYGLPERYPEEIEATINKLKEQA